MIEEKELTLEELEKVTAGYPNADKVDVLTKKIKTSQKHSEEIKYPRYITENEKLIEELPYGELTEEELDNVLAGRTR